MGLCRIDQWREFGREWRTWRISLCRRWSQVGRYSPCRIYSILGSCLFSIKCCSAPSSGSSGTYTYPSSHTVDISIINQYYHQNAFVETIAPKTDSIFSFTVSSVVSEMCLFGSIFPVFFMASYFLFFFVSSSILLPHSTAHFPIFSKFSWLCSTTSSWFLNLSPLFHFCL